jgi:predicted DNA-binding protein (MmcQ/YjbR family)
VSASVVDALRAAAFGYPGAYEDHPWGESVAKVDGKVFAFFGMADERGRHTGFTVKLPASSEGALMLPFVQSTGYGLGASGWVTVRPPHDWPVDPFLEWLDESYRAVARKMRVAELEATVSPTDGSGGG